MITNLFQLQEIYIYKPVPKPRTIRPVPAPRNIKQMVQEYEDNIIAPPLQFRDDYKPVASPRTIKNIYKKPVPLKRTKIKQIGKALKNHLKSFEVDIKNKKDPSNQSHSTRKGIETHLKSNLNEMKGFKFVGTLKVTFEKQADEFHTTIKTVYFNYTSSPITNNDNINEELKLSEQRISNKIANWISEGSGWTIESVDDHYLNITKYQPLKGSSYIQLTKELRNSSRGLINIKNDDNECFRWCHIRHINPQDVHPERIKKTDKQHIEKLDYSIIEFPVTQNQYSKIEKQNNIRINVFGYEEKQPFPIYISTEQFEVELNLLLIAGESEEVVMGRPTNEDWASGRVIQTFSKPNNSFEDDDDDDDDDKDCSYM